MSYRICVELLIELDLDSRDKEVRDAAAMAVTAERVFALVREINRNGVSVTLEELTEKDRVLPCAGGVIRIPKTHIGARFPRIDLERWTHREVAMAIDEELRSRHVGIDLLVKGIMVFFDEFVHLLLAWLLTVNRLIVPSRMDDDPLLPPFVLARNIIRGTVHIHENPRELVLHDIGIWDPEDPIRRKIRIAKEILLIQENILFKFRGNPDGRMRYGEDNRQHTEKYGKMLCARTLREGLLAKIARGDDQILVPVPENHVGEGNRMHRTTQVSDLHMVTSFEELLELPRGE